MNATGKRSHFLQCLALIGVLASLQHARAAERQATKPAAAEQPNIIVILSDDNGYADVGYQGLKDIPTPNIDSLARSGVRFSNGYVSCPVCSPTRAGLQTGRYQQRFGHEFNPGGEGGRPDFGLPLDQVTIADRLKAAGYATGVVGKWHLGFREPYNPLHRGYDEFFGFPGGAHPYLPGKAGANNPIMRGLEPVDEKEYLTDAFGREAVAFIDRHAKGPFFLYLPFNAVHAPLQATDKYIERFSQIQDRSRRLHAAQLSAMDDAIGRVIEKLRSAGLEDKTLIFFLGDNGGPTPSTTSSNLPLRGFKGQVLEGGIRVPFLVKWPGHLPEGKTYDQPVIALDIFPTAVAAAGGTLPEGRQLDGVNLLPYLTGKETKPPHDLLFWRMGPQAAVRKGDWKLIRFHPAEGAATAPAGRRAERAGRKRAATNEPALQLYNLASDIAEEHNLAAEHPEKVKELQAALDAWESQLAEPRWHGTAKPKFDLNYDPKAKGAAESPASRPAGRKPPGQRRRAE